MLREQNELLTRVGPGTPCGEMLRRYWAPAALSVELPPGGAPLPIRLLGEDLVLFRPSSPSPQPLRQAQDRHSRARGEGINGEVSLPQGGEVGLLEIHCSHRGADLSYGRLEDGGLRCIYHGWLYDRQGRCLEQPGEPAFRWTGSGDRSSVDVDELKAQFETPGSGFRDKIRHPAYPCHEAGGVIWAYLGPGEPPLFPNYELFRVPDTHRWVHKHYHECNFLQGDEGNIDSVHVPFLHRMLPGGKYNRQDVTSERRNQPMPPSSPPHCEDTHFGVRIYEFHDRPQTTYLQTKNFVLPYACAVGGGPSPTGDGYLMNWHVPIDDTHHWRYSMAFKRSGPIDPRYAEARNSVTDENYRFYRNKGNRYLQDREEQKVDTYAGLGPVFVNGDHLVTETAGAIQDRTQEHLAPTDGGIVATRQMLSRAIKDVQEGRDPPNVIRTPEQQERLLDITVVAERLAPGTTYEEYWAQRGASLARA